MSFARVKGRPSEAQRRWLMMMESLGEVTASSAPLATQRKLVELGYAEVRCAHCKHAAPANERGVGFRLVLTERGRTYLANWRKAYGVAA